MSFVPVAPSKNQSYVPMKKQSLSGRTEQARAGQLFGFSAKQRHSWEWMDDWALAKKDIIYSKFYIIKTFFKARVGIISGCLLFICLLIVLSLAKPLVCPPPKPPHCMTLLLHLPSFAPTVFKHFVMYASWQTKQVWIFENSKHFQIKLLPES